MYLTQQDCTHGSPLCWQYCGGILMGLSDSQFGMQKCRQYGEMQTNIKE